MERSFGNLTRRGGGLIRLSLRVRTQRRVFHWAQAKPILKALRRTRI